MMDLVRSIQSFFGKLSKASEDERHRNLPYTISEQTRSEQTSMNITFELSHQLIHRTDQNCLASGSRNYVYARFELLTDDWVAPITAIFGDYSVVLDSENQCLVPWEVLASPGTFSVSAFCADLHTCTCAKVTVYPSGYIEGQTPQPPTPSVYAELAGMVQQAVDTANSVQQRADAGEFNGPPGEPGPQGPKGQDGMVSFSDLTDQQKESLRGKSAYAYAQDGGFTGTEEEFAAKLAAEYPAFADVRAAAPTNLLDNSDFRYPVAQAGVGGSHGNQAYALDRWILTSGSVSHTAGVGLTLNGTITQKLEHPPAGAVSAFVGMASGSANISYSGGTVTISSAGGVIAWAALYEGTFTEQAKPEYRPKGYTAELMECMRYYQENSVYYAAYNPIFEAAPGLPFPVEMRTTPTVTIVNEGKTPERVSFWGNVNGSGVLNAPASPKGIIYVSLTEPLSADSLITYTSLCAADL